MHLEFRALYVICRGEAGFIEYMHNWSVDEKRFKKENPEEYRLWRLTQLINYGLDGEKLDREEVKQSWPKIKNELDPNTLVYLEYLLWNKRPSSRQIKASFWV